MFRIVEVRCKLAAVKPATKCYNVIKFGLFGLYCKLFFLVEKIKKVVLCARRLLRCNFSLMGNKWQALVN